MSTSPVVVLGAGLTGMSAAHHLRELGIEHRVLEARPRPGGLAITLEHDGFRFDRTGHLLHLRDPDMRKLSLDLLGNDVLTIQRRSMVWSHGRYTRYPYQANTFGLPPEVAYECLMGFLQARQRAWEGEPEDFEAFCLRHFGEGFSKHFMIPYNCRLWGVHPKEITAAWCSRFVPLPKLEDVVAGAVGLHDRELGYNAAFVYPRRGIGALTDALAARLPHIECGRPAQSIHAADKRLVVAGQTIPYRVLVSTAPLDRLVALIEDAPDAVRQAAGRLRCSSLHYLDVALDVPSGHDFHWVYVPEERYPFYRVGVYSNFSPEMAPASKACMYIELADRRPPDMDSLVPAVARHLVEMGFIHEPDQMRFALHRTIEHAYVIYDHAYYEAVDIVHGYLKERDILSTGRYGGWNYSSMEDALLFGRDVASRARDLLT
ncbi:MAG: protoporphyrinogen/coproporphyrinogen oxidase [Myxococcota bacterium]